MRGDASPENHLFVLWEKAWFAKKRILADMAREVEIIHAAELSWAGDPIESFQRFYGSALKDARRKLKHCGAGPFLVIVVRDPRPRYAADGQTNQHIDEMKRRYRQWTRRRRFRIHATRNSQEFARDIQILTGTTAEAWTQGVPALAPHPILPDWWVAVSGEQPFKAGFYAPGVPPKIEGLRTFLEGKYLNDACYSGTFQGMKCFVKHSATATWSIGNEYRLAARVYAVAPDVVPRPLAYWNAPAGASAFVATEWIAGASLSELLLKGEITASQADGFAADILLMAQALDRTGVVHRDVFTDNLLLGSDGHLKLVDWQMAILRKKREEDGWVESHWKFHYVVFGVNHDLPPGHWNDVRAFRAILDMLPQTAAVCAAKTSLAAREKAADFIVRPPLRIRVALIGYAASLLVQTLLRRKGPKRNKVWRRFLTVMGWGKTDVDGRDPELMKEQR